MVLQTDLHGVWGRTWLRCGCGSGSPALVLSTKHRSLANSGVSLEEWASSKEGCPFSDLSRGIEWANFGPSAGGIQKRGPLP